jgi:hypothetical protein
MPGYLIPGDVERIAEAQGQELSEEWLLDTFMHSEGATVLGMGPKGPVRVQIPTIVPKDRDGKCKLLTDDGKCSVHGSAPFGCSHFDTHMDEATGAPRSEAGVMAVAADLAAGGAYAVQLRTLQEKGETAEPRKVRRDRYAAAVRAVEDVGLKPQP